MSSRAASSSCSALRVLELLYALVKALGYAAGLSGAGLVLARATLLRGSNSLPSVDGPIRLAGSVLASGACASFMLLVLRLGGQWDLATSGVVLLSPLGVALALQLIGGLWLIAAAGGRAAGIGALLILLAYGVVGHSATRGLLTSISVVLHVSAAAWWLGGLWMLLWADRPLGAAAFKTLVGRFSQQGLWVVAVLIAAALLTAILLLEFHFDPMSAYARGLLAKGGLTLALLVLAGINRLFLFPRLATGPQAVRWLRRTIAAELVVFACIASVTAWLTTWQSPH